MMCSNICTCTNVELLKQMTNYADNVMGVQHCMMNKTNNPQELNKMNHSSYGLN